MTDLTYRKIEEKDVETIRSLYNKYPDFPKPLREFLPGDGRDGWVVTKNNQLIAATYAYMTFNAPYAWLEWTVADKDYKEEDKHELVSELLIHACEDLAEHGFKWCFGFSNEEQGLIPLYEEAGFEVNEIPAFEMIKRL